MNNEQLDFSVVVCAYTENRWNDLIEAVKSLKIQTKEPGEVIIVIDHNPSLFLRAKEEFASNYVKVIENHHERGLSGARNSGISVASGNVIAFMDEDAMAEPDLLAELSKGYADKNVMGVGGYIDPLWLSGRPDWFPQEFDWVVGCSYLGLPTTASPVRNLIGCNMSFRTEVFQSTGGFIHGIGRVGTLPVGCEETEICIRAGKLNKGKFFLFEPRAKVRHRVPETRANIKYFLSRCYAEGLSKALVTKLGGTKTGLKTERSYVSDTLPRGAWNGIKTSVKERSLTGIKKTFAIILGLFATSEGYLNGKIREKVKPTSIGEQSSQNILMPSFGQSDPSLKTIDAKVK